MAHVQQTDIVGSFIRGREAKGLQQQREQQLEKRGLQMQEQQLEREQAALLRPIAVEQAQLGLQQSQLGLQKGIGEAESLPNLAPFASKLLQVSDAGKLDVMIAEKQSRNDAGIFTPIIDEGIALAQGGDFVGLNESLQSVVQTGQEPQDISVSSSEILFDGTTVQSLRGGGTQVVNPQGKVVTGQEASDTIAISRAAKVTNDRQAAGARRGGALEEELDLKGKVAADVVTKVEAAKASNEGFEKVESLNRTIGLYNDALTLLDEGAKTGRIENMFPSFRAATLKLQQINKELGLDVVSNTTFGALSEGELDLAMSTALPTGLDEKDLRDWLIKKRDAQQKLSDYLEASAMFPAIFKIALILSGPRKSKAPNTDRLTPAANSVSDGTPGMLCNAASTS